MPSSLKGLSSASLSHRKPSQACLHPSQALSFSSASSNFSSMCGPALFWKERQGLLSSEPASWLWLKPSLHPRLPSCSSSEASPSAASLWAFSRQTSAIPCPCACLSTLQPSPWAVERSHQAWLSQSRISSEDQCEGKAHSEEAVQAHLEGPRSCPPGLKAHLPPGSCSPTQWSPEVWLQPCKPQSLASLALHAQATSWALAETRLKQSCGCPSEAHWKEAEPSLPQPWAHRLGVHCEQHPSTPTGCHAFLCPWLKQPGKLSRSPWIKPSALSQLHTQCPACTSWNLPWRQQRNQYLSTESLLWSCLEEPHWIDWQVLGTEEQEVKRWHWLNHGSKLSMAA